MNNVIPKITGDGETWAFWAQYAYGDITQIYALMVANPAIPQRPILPSGITILLPVIAREDSATNFANLPPWKQPN